MGGIRIIIDDDTRKDTIVITHSIIHNINSNAIIQTVHQTSHSKLFQITT